MSKYTEKVNFKRESLKPGARAHACNPRYSGGRDEERGSKPACENKRDFITS
jgi:hypothetical protein